MRFYIYPPLPDFENWQGSLRDVWLWAVSRRCTGAAELPHGGCELLLEMEGFIGSAFHPDQVEGNLPVQG